MSTPTLKTFAGGCHCGAVRYAIDLDPSNLEASKCNCSICLKTNRISLSIDPENFRLVLPASRDEVPDYQFGSKSQHYSFCDKCGIHCFANGSYEWEGKVVKNFSINAVTLDADQGLDLRELKLRYWDGKGENWGAGAVEKPPAGGCF